MGENLDLSLTLSPLKPGVNAERTTSPTSEVGCDDSSGGNTVLKVFSILSPQLINRLLKRSVYDMFTSWEVKQLCEHCNKEQNVKVSITSKEKIKQSE